MNLISYVATLPRKNHVAGNRKLETLQKFAQGVTAAGDHGEVEFGMNYRSCDVAMMLGWVHEHGKTAPHLTFRQHIVDSQKSAGRRTVIADSNLFLYRDADNPMYVLRYSFDGVFPNTGEYCNASPDPQRWRFIQQAYNMSLRDYRSQGDHILMCLQRNGGWSMSNYNVLDWALTNIIKLRLYTDRPIRVRQHPGDRAAEKCVQDLMQAVSQRGIKNVQVSDVTQPLMRDFKHCWALVNHNSSPAVGALIEGFPVFVTDPQRSQAGDVANTDFSLIENPQLPDRQKWVERISQCHWSHDDLVSGRCWQHMRQWAQP